jgi:hypothetical protein
LSSFFYTTDAGFVDFIAVMSCGAIGLAAGSKNTRVLALAIIYTFLMARAVMLMGNPISIAAGQSIAELAAFFAVLRFTTGNAARAFAALYVADFAVYAAFAASLMSFDAMGAASTVVLYLQLFLLIGGGIHDGILRLAGSRSGRHSRHRLGLLIQKQRHAIMRFWGPEPGGKGNRARHQENSP